MARPIRLNLTRDQLASFLQDFEQIKQFEKLFSTVNTSTNDTIPGAELAAGNSGEAANDALAQIAALAKLVELVVTEPRNELGTMAALQQDNVPWLEFNTQPSGFPTGPDANGAVYWDDADAIKTLNIVMEDSGEVIQHIGEETYYRVKATANIAKGDVVMFTGTVGASGGLRGAPATGLTAFQNEYIMGVATQAIANNNWGYVTWFGEVRGVNTTGGPEAWVDGQILYYNPAVAGGLTKTVPAAPNPKVIVASVVHAATNGILFVRPTFGSALGSTDSNVEITGLANGDLLQYDSSQLRWENIPATSISVGTATNLAGGAANRIAYQTAPGATGFITAPTVSNTFLEWSGSAFQWSPNPLGTVTSVSVVSANGFAGTVATATTTPAITLTTTITGLLKGNGSAISAATQDVDYVAPSAPVTKTADFTVANGETWFINNKSGSTCTVTLPSAASFPGRCLTFQNNQDQSLISASSNVIPQGGGAAGTAILTNVSGNWATLVSNGTNWVIMQAASFNNLLY